MGSVRRFFSGLNPERLERKIAAEARAAQAGEDAAQAVSSDIAKHEANIRALRGEIDHFTAATRAYPPVAEVQSRLTTLRTRLGQIRERVTAIDQELAAPDQEVLAHCRIFATTVYRTYHARLPCASLTPW